MSSDCQKDAFKKVVLPCLRDLLDNLSNDERNFINELFDSQIRQIYKEMDKDVAREVLSKLIEYDEGSHTFFLEKLNEVCDKIFR